MSTIRERLGLTNVADSSSIRERLGLSDYVSKPQPIFTPKVANSKMINNIQKNTWFNKGAFEDGYQFGDVLKTTASTIGNVGTNLLKGVFSAGEAVGDLAAYGGAQVLDWLGADNYANQVRETASKSLTNQIFDPVDDFLSKNSLLGEKSQNVVSSIGNMYAQAVSSKSLLGAKYSHVPLKVVDKTFNLPTTSFIQGASGGISEAYSKGAEDWQAWASGVGSGMAESIAESAFGTFGIGGSDLDDALIKSVTNKMKNSVIKNMTKVGLKATGEGVEEVVSYLLNYSSGKILDYAKNKLGLSGVDIANEFNKQELWDNFIGGAVAAGVGGLPSTINSIRGSKNNIDITEGINQFKQSNSNNNIDKAINYVNTIQNTNVNNNNVNSMLLNKTSAPVVDSMGNVVNPSRYQYTQSNNVKIDNLRKVLANILIIQKTHLGYHHFVTPINIDSTIYRVLISGKEKQNFKRLYSLNTEILPQKNGNVPLVNTKSGYQSSGTLPSNISISDLAQHGNILVLCFSIVLIVYS